MSSDGPRSQLATTMDVTGLAAALEPETKVVKFVCNEPYWVEDFIIRKQDKKEDLIKGCATLCHPTANQMLVFENAGGSPMELSYKNFDDGGMVRVRVVRRREAPANRPEPQYIDVEVHLHDEYVLNPDVPRPDRTENPLMTPKMGSALQRIKNLWGCAPHNALPDEIPGPQVWSQELHRRTVKLAEHSAGNFAIGKDLLLQAYNQRQPAASSYLEPSPELSVADVQKAIDLAVNKKNKIIVPRELTVDRKKAAELLKELTNNNGPKTAWQIAIQGNWKCSLDSFGELPGRVPPAGYVPCLPETIRPRHAPSKMIPTKLADVAKLDEPDRSMIAMHDWSNPFTHALAVLSQFLKGYHAYAVWRLEEVVKRRQDQRDHKKGMKYNVRELMVDDIKELIGDLIAEAEDPQNSALKFLQHTQPSYQ